MEFGKSMVGFQLHRLAKAGTDTGRCHCLHSILSTFKFIGALIYHNLFLLMATHTKLIL